MCCPSDILIGYIASNMTWRSWSIDTRTLSPDELAWDEKPADFHSTAEGNMGAKADELGYMCASIAIGGDLYIFRPISTMHLFTERKT